MVKNKFQLLFVFLLVGLLGCATPGKKAANKIRNLVKQGDYQGALLMAQGKKYYPGNESKLLKLLDSATILHLKGDYQASLKTFDEAKKLSDSLFTVSISKKIKTFFANDSSDNYYGEIYERSFIRFYQVLNHYLLSLDPKTDEKVRRSHLMSARAVLLEWDSMLDGYKNDLKGKVTYKEDMSAKTFGAYIHEIFDTSGDRTIAKSLYKEGNELLVKNYSAYPSYNYSYEKFKKDFEKFPKLGMKKVQKDYISKSGVGTELVSFLNERKKKVGKGDREIVVLLNEGFIEKKKARKIKIPIGLNTLPPGITKKRDFVRFLRKTLSISSATVPTISYELPSIRSSYTRMSKDILVKDEKGKIVAKSKAVIVNPLSEIAYNTLDQQMGAVKTKIGTRVAAKHVTALAAAFITYRSSVKRGQKEFLASAIAGASYAIANKGIEASEQADLRHWTTLPNVIRLSRLKVKPGKYKVYVKSPLGEKFISDVTVTSKDRSTFIKKRLF